MSKLVLLLTLYNSRCLDFCMVGFGGRGDSTIGPLPNVWSQDDFVTTAAGVHGFI